ncbi:MAG: hypothetical protein ACOY3Y_13620 [Acidobacteriota bacterium]
MRGRGWMLWAVAVTVTLSSAVWQRLSGPTYPVRGAVRLGADEIGLRLTRSHGGDGDHPVRVRVADEEVTGEVAWRRYPTKETWHRLGMARDGEWLVAALPHQPPAGKLEYQVRLHRGADAAVFPERPAVTRFKGSVPAAILIPHIFAMFVGMLVSNRAGLEALAGGPAQGRLAAVALALLGVGGLLLGPAVQKAAFDAWWTGWPFGHDLTDNKTAVVVLAWAWAAWRAKSGRGARGALLVASLVTLAVFAIPHSTWGSELRWDEVAAPGSPGVSAR